MSLRGIELALGADIAEDLLASQGYGFVVGSLGAAADGHLTASQARDYIAAGLAIVSVFDAAQQGNTGTEVGYDPRLFEEPESLLHTLAYSNGATDGRAAHDAAKAVGQPAGTAIYFEINADVTAGIAFVLDYFRGVAEGLAQAAGGSAAYRVGVYGSGFVIDSVYDAGLADFKWLASPPAWQGTDGYADYDIRETVLSGDATLSGAALRADDVTAARPDNNVGQWSVSATVPNLVINDLAVRAQPQPAGGVVPISFAIGNAGTAAAGTSAARLYLSTDETITPDDTVLGVFDVPALGAMSATAGSLSWTIPADTAPGTYWIGIAVDPVAGESSSTDNAYAVSYTVTASPSGSPNMVINALSLGAPAVAAGAQQAISFEVGNAGASATAATTATLYLSTDATITSADTFLGAFPIAALAPGGATARSLSATIPAGMAEGTYYIGVVAGPVAGESNINDNIYATSFTVGGAAPAAPNLVINDLSLDRAVAAAGGEVSIDVAIGNAGAAAAAASKASLYLSADETITVGDILLGSIDLPSIAAGAAHSGHLVATIPSGSAAGSYYVGVIAGPVAGEPNVNDNIYAVGLKVARVPGSVSVAGTTVVEGNSGTTLASFVVTRTGGTQAFSVDYTTSDGGATVADGDYAPVAGTLSFAEGEMVRTVTVEVQGDLTDESHAPQDFFVTLSGGTAGVAITGAPAQGIILDDDQPNILPVLVGRDIRMHAGQAGSAAAMVQSVTDGDDDAILKYSFRDTGAGGGFLRAGGVAQAWDGWVTVAAADLPGLEYVAGATEGTEAIDIRVFDGKGWSAIVQATAATIDDTADDHGETPETAGAIGGGMFVRGTIETARDADWFAVAMTAGERYRFDLEGSATGEGTLGDPVLELRDASGALVQLGMHDEGTGGTLARLVYTATANDTLYLAARAADDGLGTYRLAATAQPLARLAVAALGATRAEGQAGTTPFTFVITREGNLDVAAEIAYAVSGTGAHPAAAADFAGDAFPSGSVAFAAGETLKTVTIGVLGDRLAEDNDSFALTISSLSNDVVITQASAGGLILDDDAILDLAVFNTLTGERMAATPRYYDGPVSGLEKEVILVTPENLNVAVSGSNWFIRTGDGMDALNAHGGRNVLDGGAGSNFLTGAAGEDSFFLDARGAAADIWSTIVGFGAEDSVTVWGISAEASALAWVDDLGAEGYRGLTLQATAPGGPTASVTLAGFSQADLASGRLQVASGLSAESDPYLYIRLAA